MKISKRVALYVSAIIFVYIAIVFAVLKLYVGPQFNEMEIRETEKEISIYKSAIEREVNAVNSYCVDYARWDDTYNYVAKPYEKYVNDNLKIPSLSVQRIHFFHIIDLSGKVKYSAAYNPVGYEPIEISDLKSDMSDLGKFILMAQQNPQGIYKGMVITDEGLMLISTYPILDSEQRKPVNGRLFSGRFFSREEMNRMREIYQGDFDLWTDFEGKSGVPPVAEILKKDKNNFLRMESGKIFSFSLFQDVNSNPSVLLTVRHEMGFATKGFMMLNLAIFVLLGCAIVVLLSIMLFLKRNVLFPIEEMKDKSIKILGEMHLSGKLPVGRKDEIGTLAESFNRLLEKLSEARSNLEKKVEERTAALERSNKELLLHGKVFENSLDGIVILNSEGKIIKVNPAFTRITGFSESEAVGASPDILKTDRHNEEFYAEIIATISEKMKWSGEIWGKNKRGRFFPGWVAISTIPNLNESTVFYMAVFHDISDAKQQESYIKYQAYHDGLTGLPNRVLLYERINRAVERTLRNKEKFAILYLDLDHFKTINDSLGHEAGDILLQHVSERMEKLLRASDTIARLGGDEFIILVENIENDNQPALLAERILASFKNAFVIKDKVLHVGTSIGIAIFPDDGAETSILMRNADTAMYMAKEDGRLRYCHFTKEMNEKVSNRMKLENELRMAIMLNQFEVHYQPKMNLKTGEIESVEGLTRWNKDESLVNPLDFIPIAEETGLIVALDMIVLETACSQIMMLNQNRKAPLKLAMNASVKALQRKNFPDEILQVLERTGMKPEFLEIEIIETQMMKDIESCLDVIFRIAEAGVSIAIDDFGTGYSSLSRLTKIPVNTLKIDISFISKIGKDKGVASIIDTIHSMARELHLKVVAEGVETEEQLDFLMHLGCDMVQGYLISKPLSLDGLEQFLKEKK